MPDLERKKRAEMPTVPKMRGTKVSAPTKPRATTTKPAQSAETAEGAVRTKRPPKRRPGGLVEEMGDRARRDPRREQD